MSEISERLRLAREKSKKRKELLDCTLGSSWAEELGSESSFKSKRLNDETSKASILEPQNHLKNTSPNIFWKLFYLFFFY